MRRAVLTGLAVAGIATGVTACGGSSSSSGGGGGGSAGGGTAAGLSYGATQPLLTFDPAQAQAAGDQGLYLEMVYDNLVTQSSRGVPQPQLATSWNVDSPTRYTFTLRRGVTYQDGSAFTAATAKASLERVLHANGPRASSLASIASIDAVGPTKLRIVLKHPNPDLLTILASSPGAMLSPKAFDRKDLASDPDGTGPYTYSASQSVRGDHYVFTRKARWWDSSTPRASSVTFKVLADDTARLNALKTGQIQIATIDPGQVSEAQGSGLKIAKQVNTWEGLLILDREGKTVPALGSPLVRQAMAEAIDRKSIASTLYAGNARPAAQVVAEGNPGYDAALDAKYVYDPAHAKQLLARAGFSHFGFTAPIAASQQSVYEAIKSQLAAVGITMNLQVEPPGTAADIARTTKFPVLTFPLPAYSLYSRYLALWSPKAGFNPFGIADPALTKLVGRYAVAPASGRASLAAQINALVADQGLAVVAAQPDDIAAYSSKLSGVAMTNYTVPQLRGIS